MTKIDIFSGFLGAGKTTLIKKLISEAYTGEKLVLIENEFGEISVDGGFLEEAGIEIREMSSGCICCSLVGDFADALQIVKRDINPDRILIEPSGVGKLSDIVRAVQDVGDPELVPGSLTTVVDATRAKMYMKNFGEFWNNQVENAAAIVLSRTGGMKPEKLDECIRLLRGRNPNAAIVTTPWDKLSGADLRAVLENEDSLKNELTRLNAETGSGKGHAHADGGSCACGHHHHDHTAAEAFSSWGSETPRKYTKAGVEKILEKLDSGDFGQVLRSKGYLDSDEEEGWVYFDYVPGEHNVRRGGARPTGRLCVIGAKLDEAALKELFGLD